MSLKFRAVAVVGVLVLALCGCQKGNGKASSRTPDAEAMKADSKSGKTSMKSGTASRKNRNVPAEESKSSSRKGTSHAGAMKSGTLTEADNEMEFEFRQGQIITVVLDSNHETGLAWALVEPMGSVIVPSGTGAYAARAGKTARGTETWHFRCAKPGFQTVKMEYRRKWAQSMPERTFRFSGTVH